MCANDECDWMRREIDWLDVPLAEGKPFLGICLGAQMLARALGARVFTYEDKRSEIGYVPIEPNAAADRLCAEPFPRSVYQWHTDGFDLPAGAELLATGAKDFPNQAYRYGKTAIGLQFHPEVTYHMMCRWTIRGAERLTRPGAQPRPGHLGGWYQHDGRVADWLEAFLPAWTEGRLGEARAPQRPAVSRPKPAETPKHLMGRRPPAPAGRPASLAELVS
jgi:GMP synthase (glutamine-hydrolysing)